MRDICYHDVFCLFILWFYYIRRTSVGSLKRPQVAVGEVEGWLFCMELN